MKRTAVSSLRWISRAVLCLLLAWDAVEFQAPFAGTPDQDRTWQVVAAQVLQAKHQQAAAPDHQRASVAGLAPRVPDPISLRPAKRLVPASASPLPAAPSAAPPSTRAPPVLL